MSLLVPKSKYSRLQLPYGVASPAPTGYAGFEEPLNAMPGTLSFDQNRQVARVKKSSPAGWQDLGYPGTMYQTPPNSADLWNDEFDAGNDDPALRGWTMLQLQPAILALTRLGAVDATIVPATAMAAGTYRSSIHNNKLYLQIGGNAGNVGYMYKATTNAAFAYASIMSNSFGGANAYNSLHVTSSVATPFPSVGVNSVSIETPDKTVSFIKHTGAAGVTFTTNGPDNGIYRPLAKHIDWNGATVSGWASAADAEFSWTGALAQVAPVGYVPAFAGVLFRQANAAGAARNWTVVECLRRYPSGTFWPV